MASFLSGSEITLIVCGKYALLAVRMSRRLGSPHGSFMSGPSQIREPSQCPREFVGSLIASMIGRSAWPHSHRTQTSERSPLVPRSSDPEGSTAGRSSAVGEGVPVDVADVALLACPDETDRHDGLRFLLLVDELALPGERGPVDKSTRPDLAPRFLTLAALRDEPLGELYRVDTGLPCRSRIIVCRWGGMEHQGRKLQQVLQLGKQTGLVDLVTLG